MLQLDDIEELKQIAKGDEELMEMERIIEEISEDEEIIGLYDKEEMDALVAEVNLAEAKKEGVAEGLEQGMEISKRETAKNMLKEKIDIELITKVTGLSQEEIENLQ